jgi:hypothetical protein
MLRANFNCVAVAFLTCVLLSSIAVAVGDGANSSISSETIRYNPPARSGDHVRVDGKSHRGPGKFPNLFFLTPDHVGETVQEQPTLYWYLSESTDRKLVVTITKDGDADPVLESVLPSTAGIGKLSLAEKNIKLEQDVEYQVTFALITDEKNRSDDVCASGIIKRVKPPEALVARLVARADPIDRVAAYAKEGIWYDAMTVISEQIDGKDTEPATASSMRRQRAELLEQVSLNDVANFDLGTEEKQ